MASAEVSTVIRKAIAEGVPLFNRDNVKECVGVYFKAAEAAASFSSDSAATIVLLQAIEQAKKAEEDGNKAWILRRAFDTILNPMSTPTETSPPGEGNANEMESLASLLTRSLHVGVPLYNQGDIQGCYEVYRDAARLARDQEALKMSAVGQLLEQALEEAQEAATAGNYGEAAWVMRRYFDDILDLEGGKNKTISKVSPDAPQKRNLPMDDGAPMSKSFRGALLRSSGDEASDDGFETNSSSSGGSSSTAYWQDEKIKNTSDYEIGSCLADVAYILRASIVPTKHKRYTGKTYEDTFQGLEAVEVLTALGLAKNRKMAVKKCSMLMQGSFLLPVSYENQSKFRDGTYLYRFPDQTELQKTLGQLIEKAPFSSEGHRYAEGSAEAQLVIALQNTLEIPMEGGRSTDNKSKFSGVSARHLQPLRMSVLSPEHVKGFTLAQLCAKIEKTVEIQDRTYLFKKYENCFVGSEAVHAIVKAKIVESFEEAMQVMTDLVSVGLVHHVLHDHIFKNEYLFYSFTFPSDIKRALDAISILPSGLPTSGTELVRQTALMERYKQYADLDVAAILNSFFGSETEEGWDLVDLQNWRNNMKRWGFGRREDQDDEMVDKLSPLALNVDPEVWYEKLSPEEKEKWESPFGILAQIAIFDQVPRSAFRGTVDAFKWDVLAIKASKVAIEKGYFESAYKSTLNQFLVLLPLEHSESWEDQKLGVTLLLKLLSTVAVQDEDLSDYEIVKRLEFSKRLTTAFLEHAQVIAKFKRYPHRNKPLGRNTTLEERVWLASDLVPRWAKSQNPEDGRNNVIQLPVIPLKRLTRR